MRNAFSKPETISRIELTKHLLRAAGLNRCADDLSDDQPVYDMEDGGMGSFSFVPSRETAYPVSKASYKDDDGVEVRITLFVDGSQQPTEVEFWKVDFERLISFPSPNQLTEVQAIR